MNKYLLVGGGIATLGLAYLAKRKASGTTQALKNAIAGVKPAMPNDNDDDSSLSSLFSLGPTDDTPTVPVTPPGSGPTVQLRLTGYWPFTARPDEVQMEGGLNDRLGNPLHTLLDAQTGKAPFVSCSGDYTIWPYGQLFLLDEFPGIKFRVVDTGSHFVGAKKQFRKIGWEPIDVCVSDSSVKLPTTVNAHIVAGDTLAAGKKGIQDIAYNKFKGQTVAGIVAPIKTGGNV